MHTHRTADCRKHKSSGKIKPKFKPKGRGNNQDDWRKSYKMLMFKFDVMAKKAKKQEKRPKSTSATTEKAAPTNASMGQAIGE